LGKKMQNPIKYTIFTTKWGYFGFAGTEHALCRTHLPGPEPEKIKARLLRNLPAAQFDRALFNAVQDGIAAYFAGERIELGPEIPVDLDALNPFNRSVLVACRQVQLGRTISYSGLAKMLGKPTAARAVGNALAKNPLPLIIPCHRIIRTDGKLGGFSALGGLTLKKRMLELERQALRA